MPSRFQPGAAAFAKDGRRYVVAEVEDGIVYCRSEAGAETEFPEAQLFTAAEQAARGGTKTDLLYGTIRQAKAYAPYRGTLDGAAAARLLAKADRLVPGILDFTAFVAADRALAEAGQSAAGTELSIVTCREIFESSPLQSRVALLAGLIGSPPEVLVGAADLGDNLLRAMVAKAAKAGGLSLDDFLARRRR